MLPVETLEASRLLSSPPGKQAPGSQPRAGPDPRPAPTATAVPATTASATQPKKKKTNKKKKDKKNANPTTAGNGDDVDVDDMEDNNMDLDDPIDDEEEEDGEDLYGDGMGRLVFFLLSFFFWSITRGTTEKIHMLIFSFASFRDYEARPELDRYNISELDENEYDPIDADVRAAAERALNQRDGVNEELPEAFDFISGKPRESFYFSPFSVVRCLLN
jgi:hypothetical protein